MIRSSRLIATRVARAPRWALSALVLVAAVAVRLPHYDVAWFGVDQVFFMAEARRIVSGHWDAKGPLASGLNIVGPLYSYLLAVPTWFNDRPDVVGLLNVVCEVAACWLVFDAARRFAGRPQPLPPH